MNAETRRERVADVLATWNPIGVPLFLAHDEYKAYVDPILAVGNDRDRLAAYLTTLLTQTCGLPYNEGDAEHRKDLNRVVRELLQVLQDK
jgi:hypothetical protein